MQQIGEHGSQRLTVLWSAQSPAYLRSLAAVEGLRGTWGQPFCWQEGRITVRNKDDFPPAGQTIRSPYDHQAHYGHKRDAAWFGYKVHCSETGEEQGTVLPEVKTVLRLIVRHHLVLTTGHLSREEIFAVVAAARTDLN